jgi:hypothetical protein
MSDETVGLTAPSAPSVPVTLVVYGPGGASEVSLGLDEEQPAAPRQSEIATVIERKDMIGLHDRRR